MRERLIVAGASNGNGFWLKVVGSLLVAVVLAAASVLWSLNGRVTRNETRVERIGRDIAEIKGDVKVLLRFAKPEPSR